MPSAVPTPPPLTKWQRPAKTKYDLDWADLEVINLSNFEQEKAGLAAQLRRGVHRDGFFGVTGTGLTDEEVNRQYSIAQAYFDRPTCEKAKEGLCCDFEKGNYFGYRGYNQKKIMGTPVLDNVESVNIPKYIPSLSHEPRDPYLRPFDAEIEAFQHKAYEHVITKIFILFALALELADEHFFVNRHRYDDKSEDHLRYMLYHPRTVEDDRVVHNTWSRSHTDFGSLTLLWSQEVAGLQIRTAEGAWKYVRPVDGGGGGGIVCNVGDTLAFWSAGYLRSTVHRVVRPPPDQCEKTRLGLFYFVRPGDETELVPCGSPLLVREGLVEEEEEGRERDETKAVKGGEYVRERVKNYHSHGDYKDMTGQKFRVGNLEIEDQVA